MGKKKNRVFFFFSPSIIFFLFSKKKGGRGGDLNMMTTTPNHWKGVKSILKFCFGENEKSHFDNQFAANDIHRIDERYLPPLKNFINKNPIKYRQILFVRSAMGTGKSSRVLEYISRSPTTTALIISSRITYTEAFCSKKRYGFRSYRDVRGRDIDYLNHPRIVIQYQSLSRIKCLEDTETFARWDILFLDEIDSLLKEALSSGTMSKSKRCKTIRYFQKLVSSIPTVIVCDANLAEWHCDAILRKIAMVPKDKQKLLLNQNTGIFATSGRNINVFTNYSLCPSQSNLFMKAIHKVSGDANCKKSGNTLKHLINLDRDLTVRQNSQSISFADHVYMSILANWFCKEKSSNLSINSFIVDDASKRLFKEVINEGKCVVAICNTKVLAYYVCAFFIHYAHLKLGEDVVILTGDSEIYQKRRVTSCDTMADALKACKLFIFTSCVKVGVDFSVKRFDSVFLFLSKIRKTSPLNLSDLFQMVGRIRHFDSLSIAINQLPSLKKGEEDFCPSPINNVVSFKKFNRLSDNADNILLYLTNITGVEFGIKRYPITFFKCLLKMFVREGNRDHDISLYYAGNSYSDIYRLHKSISKRRRLNVEHIFECIITTYRKYAEFIANFKDQLIDCITKKLSSSTQLFSFDAFQDFLLSCEDKHKTVEDLYFMVTALSTLKGILVLYSEIDQTIIEHYFDKYNRTPLQSIEEIENSMMCADDSEFDFRFDNDRIYPPNFSYNKIKFFLYKAANRLCKNLNFDSFNDILPEIKAAIKFKSNDQKIIEKIYSVFISDYIPVNFDYTLGIVNETLRGGVCPSKINVNKFLVFVSN